MAEVLKGAPVAAAITEGLISRTRLLVERGITPCLPVKAFQPGTLFYRAGIGAKAQGPALFSIPALPRQEIYYLILALLVKLSRIRIPYACNIPCILYDHDLHSEANTEIGKVILPRKGDRIKHTFYAPHAEASGYQYAI